MSTKLNISKLKKRRRLKLSPESLLIKAIYEKNDGMAAVARLLTKLLSEPVSTQLLNFWKTQGAVPLYRVPKVSKALNVPPLTLNFREGPEFFGKENTNWGDVVKSARLAKEVESDLLNRTWPPQ